MKLWKIWGYRSKYTSKNPLIVDGKTLDDALRKAREVDSGLCACQPYDQEKDGWDDLLRQKEWREIKAEEKREEELRYESMRELELTGELPGDEG